MLLPTSLVCSTMADASLASMFSPCPTSEKIYSSRDRHVAFSHILTDVNCIQLWLSSANIPKVPDSKNQRRSFSSSNDQVRIVLRCTKPLLKRASSWRSATSAAAQLILDILFFLDSAVKRSNCRAISSEDRPAEYETNKSLLLKKTYNKTTELGIFIPCGTEFRCPAVQRGWNGVSPLGPVPSGVDIWGCLATKTQGTAADRTCSQRCSTRMQKVLWDAATLDSWHRTASA